MMVNAIIEMRALGVVTEVVRQSVIRSPFQTRAARATILPPLTLKNFPLSLSLAVQIILVEICVYGYAISVYCPPDNDKYPSNVVSLQQCNAARFYRWNC